jgi:hypothetical protein
MPNRKKRWLKRVATHRSSLYTKRVVTLCVGASLFVGGATEAFDNTHFSVEKDLDRVNVVRKKGSEASVVATLEGKYTSNSVYKLARIVPDRFVTEQLNLFDAEWLPVLKVDTAPLVAENRLQPVTDVRALAKDISIINDKIREEFFKTIPFGELIHRKAEKYDVDPILMAAIMEQESRFKPRAKSPVGARGLMQLMPRTGYWMGARNLYDPEQNVDAGAKYLRYLDKRFKGDTRKVIAAYNAGEGNVIRYRGTPPFRETRQYVKKVTSNYSKRQRQLAAFSAKAEAR